MLLQTDICTAQSLQLSHLCSRNGYTKYTNQTVSQTKPYLITDLSRFVQTHQVPQLQMASTNVSGKDAIRIRGHGMGLRMGDGTSPRGGA